MQAVGRNGMVTVAAAHDAVAARMVVTVRDPGPGIANENLSQIFEPFFTTKEDGSGLGLWTVPQIVLAHAAVVGAANTPDGGAVFTLVLPQNGPEVLHE